MSIEAPPIDARTAAEFERQLVALLGTYTPAWHELDAASGRATGVSAALIGVFARFAEIVVQRLNRAPEKNELAFLDLIGASPLPGQPARAPLSFALAPGAKGAVVPARTQVAAPPAPDRPAPILFETLRELAVTPATLARVVTWDATTDRKADHSRVADPANDDPAVLFRGDGPLEHVFYVGEDDLLSYPTVTGFGLSISLNNEPAATPDPRTVQWEIWDGKDGIALTPTALEGRPADSTNALTTSGYVGFPDIGQVPLTTVAGITSRWLRCRLLTPITTSADPVPGYVRATQLPVIGDLLIEGVGRAPPRPPDAAFAGTIPLDVSRDHLPFGPDPKFGAVWYLASRAVLSQTGRRIGVSLTLTDPASGIPHPGAGGTLAFKWEYFGDAGWTELGTSGGSGSVPAGVSYFSDGAARFTGTGDVTFVCPTPPRATIVNGVENYWLRVRLMSGTFTPAGASPPAPSLASVLLYYDRTNSGLNFDGARWFVREDALSDVPIKRWSEQQPAVLLPTADAGRSLYLGLAFSAGDAATNRPISLWADLQPLPAGATPDQPLAAAAPTLGWSYWDGAGWTALTVADETRGFTVSGEIRLIPPADIAPIDLFRAGPLRWLRATWSGGDYKFLPRLRRLLLNTTLGEQAVTVPTETLGSSDGQPGQRFKAAQSPIFEGVALDVIEPESPTQAERDAIAAAAAGRAIVPQPGGGVSVPWAEVGDFYGSGPRDRHFVVDHQTGTILFGDGVSGLIPPRGAGNIRLAGYRTGIGARGDVAAGGISQLKTTLPYVSGVANPVAATGGVGAESLDAMRERAPRLIRHGGRAVTIDDFEDLARLASPEVARSRCVPLYDLSVDPDGTTRRPGVVSVIVVPRADSAAPAPAVDLVQRVTDYLAARALASIAVVVVGPEYVTVDVHAEIGVARIDGAGAVEDAARAALAAFLHPLTGGFTGTGWDFGRRPHRSDLYTLLQGIDGVDHLRALDVVETPARAGVIETGRFLVCSGRHQLALSFGSL